MSKKKANGTTVVSICLDESGSMDAVRQETIDGFNAFIRTLAKSVQKDKRCLVNLVKFNTAGVNKVISGVNVQDTPELNTSNYRPGACTNLIDAACDTIKATAEYVEHLGGNPNVQVMIQTDGYENSSRHYTNADLADLIKQYEAQGWVFTFMGADIDAYAVAGQYGIQESHTVSYSSDNTEEMFAASARNTTMYANSGLRASAAFSDTQKAALGDPTVKLKSRSRSPSRSQQQPKPQPAAPPHASAGNAAVSGTARPTGLSFGGNGMAEAASDPGDGGSAGVSGSRTSNKTATGLSFTS